MMIDILEYEMDALMEWHRNQQYECASKEDYVSAEDHKRRFKALQKILADAKAK